MPNYTIVQLKRMRLNPQSIIIAELIEDLLDAYALLDKQQEEYQLKIGKIELIGRLENG